VRIRIDKDAFSFAFEFRARVALNPPRVSRYSARRDDPGSGVTPQLGE
jgi:hypothetical protein